MKPYPYTRRYNDRGKNRIEYRRYGRCIALTGQPGTMEFQLSYEDAKARVDGAAIVHKGEAARPDVIKHGTLRWLGIEWFKSAEFAQLSPPTQRDRRRVLEAMFREPADRDGSKFLFGQYPLTRLEAKHVRVLRDRKRDMPGAAYNRLKALRVLFQWAIENDIGGVKRNVARDVPMLKNPSEGHHPWTDGERESYKNRHPIGNMARLAYELFFHTGQRSGDVWSFGPHNIRNGSLVFTQEKNRARKPVHLELPIMPELQAALDATKTGETRFLVNAYGKPFASKDTLRGWFRDRCKEAGLPARCTAHGIRKASATYHADNGATSNELMAIHGWRSLQTADEYIRAANQKKLAARAMRRNIAKD
jgi:site-specific recombinase XerD